MAAIGQANQKQNSPKFSVSYDIGHFACLYWALQLSRDFKNKPMNAF